MVTAPPQPSVEELEVLVDGARYGDLDDVVAALGDGVPVDAADEHGRTGVFPTLRRCTICGVSVFACAMMAAVIAH